MADVARLNRQLARTLRTEEAPVTTGRVQSVDRMGRTALVRMGGSASAARFRIVSQTLADQLHNRVAAGHTPTVTIRDGLIIDYELGMPTSTTTTTLVIEGVDVSQLNTDFYAHLGEPSAHHAAFIGLEDDTGAVASPAGDYRIQIAGGDGVSSVASSGTLTLNVDATVVRTSRQILPGDGLAGGGALSGDVTLTVDTSVVRTSRTISPGAGLAGGGNLSANRTLSLDLAAHLTWTGNHVFQGSLSTRHLLPESNDAYDIGSVTRYYNAAYISRLEATMFTKQTLSLVGGYLRIANAGTLTSEVLSATTQVDFGQTMVTGQFVELRAFNQFEYMSVGSNVTGTIYNVTRALSGGTPPIWPAGTPYQVVGNGSGFIDLNASAAPRLSLITQGSTYNVRTEIMRLGDLINTWGYDIPTYGTQIYGLALGEYASGKANLTWDPTNGLRLRTHSTTVIQLNNSGGASFTAPLSLGTNGGFYGGSGTFAAPTTGIKMWIDSGVGRLASYSSGTLQVGFNTAGELEAGAGFVKLNAAGLKLKTGVYVADTQSFGADSVRWVRTNDTDLGAVTVRAYESQYFSGQNTMDMYVKKDVNGDSTYGSRIRLRVDDGLFESTTFLQISGGTTYGSTGRIGFHFAGSNTPTAYVEAGKLTTSGFEATGSATFSGSLFMTGDIYRGRTSFPTGGSGLGNQVTYRYDQNRDYFYDGTNWLSVIDYPLPISEFRMLAPLDSTKVSTSDAVYWGAMVPYGRNVKLVGVTTMFNVAGTNNNLNHYIFTLELVQTGGGPTTAIGTINTFTNGGAANTDYVVTTNYTSIITNDATYKGVVLQLKVRRVGTPGALTTCHSTTRFRFVGA